MVRYLDNLEIEKSINKTFNNLNDKVDRLQTLVHKNKIYEQYPNFDEEYYQAHKKWNYDIQKALSLGYITEKEADKLGWYGAIGDSKIVPLPQILYHTTTNKDDVIEHGLKTRDELSIKSGYGLGGGASDTVSFTESLHTAIVIKDTLIEAQKVASGKTDLETILEHAKSGKDAKRPYYENLHKYYTINKPDYFDNLKEGKTTDYSIGHYTEEDYNKHELEMDRVTGWEPLDEGLKGSDGIYRHHHWIRNLSNDEILDKTFDVYKKCLAWREDAGGREDPLFFLSDVKALGNINPNQIAVLQFKPIENAHGFKMSALGEWRTYTGEAVEFVQEIK